MTDDLSIREQSYRYFLQEAPELLQALEQELLSLREDYSINRVHNLMRTTHTLKGAAASVGLETIKTVAHSLEDIFKSLFNPDLSIDAEVEALLFEGYECLRLSLTAELTGGQVNDTEILDRTAAIFAQLQEKLGDFFSSEARIPTSVELGFDVTQSIFEVGVAQRLEELATVVASAEPAAITSTLRTQCDVFQGLAESLGLPGFGAIAQAATMALDAHPEQVVAIAQTALVDFQAGQTAVLNGDRVQGGQPSLVLQQLAGLATSLTAQEEDAGMRDAHDAEASSMDLSTLGVSVSTSSSLLSLPNSPVAEASGGLEFFDTPIDTQELATQSELDSVTGADESHLSASESQNEESDNLLLEVIWGGDTASDSQTSELGQEVESWEDKENAASYPSHRVITSSQEPEVTVETPSSQRLGTASEPTPIPPKEMSSQPRTVRVNVEHLEHLNYSIGELLTNQNLQSLQSEQLQTSVRVLLNRLKQHQQRLSELQDWSDRMFVDAEKRRIGEWGTRGPLWGLGAIGNQESGIGKNLTHPHSSFQNPKSKILSSFDSLELDRYNEAQLLVQSILEDAVQLAEASEAIELFANQSTQALEKQRRLLTGSRDALLEARMLPLAEIVGRFPRVLQQLATLHDKSVGLEIRGTEVLVDKVVAEKLYGPLLHLVRNAFDHGIEPPAIRQQSGKPKQGEIKINAYHRGRFLAIEVRDDGQGLNYEKIRQRAVEGQFITHEQASSFDEQQLTDLLFEPGFSTASQVNDLSGRGIGLDMVRAQVQALQGSVSVYSELHRGTTFVLQIPLSLTITKLLVIQAGDRMYALLAPSMYASTSHFAIEQILIPQGHQIRAWEGGKVLQWGKDKEERLIPVHQLSTILNYSSQLPQPFVSQPQRSVGDRELMKPIILIRSQDTLLGLEVDQLIGEQELVIRPLGAAIAPPDYVYGGSILADGRLTLVIDGAALMQYVFDQQTDDVTEVTFTSSPPHLLELGQRQRQLPGQIRAALPAGNQGREEEGKTVRQKHYLNSGQFILLVDDSITLRQTLALTLQKAGYQVLQAKDGYEAIEQLQRHNGIQLIICDIEMPRMNGFEFLKYHQQDPALASIPVVILTSRSGEKHRLIASELGATDYITKPFLERKLIEKVADVLEKNVLNSVV
jgi:two-component system, chemotaxis family, sensor histidine kinase and response regulator PixL